MGVPRITDEVCDPIEDALERFTQPNEVLAWDVFWQVTPTPAGPQPLLVLLIGVKHPLLGYPPLYTQAPFHWPAVWEPKEINDLVLGIVSQLRAARAAIVQGAN